MTDILEQIFYGEYSAADRVPSAAYRKLMDQSKPLWDRVYDAVGKEVGDRLWENQCAMTRAESLETFKEGAYLGAMLMLELLYGTPQGRAVP